MLEERFKTKVFPRDFSKLEGKGSYVLVVYVRKPTKFRRWIFKKGIYLYVGSALNEYKRRLSRYLNIKRKFWHIDYLLDHGEILWAYLSNKGEVELAKELSHVFHSIECFGNSDDKENSSHLFYVPPMEYVTRIFNEESRKRNAPVFYALKQTSQPYERFIFVFLSSRTKDEKTLEVTKKFVKRYPTWEKVREASLSEVEDILYGVAFHKQKAKNMKKIANILKGREIPKDYEALIALPGIGKKIAKVILADVFKENVIGVDTHVHRITNRLGWVNTKKEDETDRLLNMMVPDKLKHVFNISFVGYGQTVCLPKNPKCGQCMVKEYCDYYLNNLHLGLKSKK